MKNTIARVALVGLVAGFALVAGCNSSGRVEETKASAKAEGTCAEGKAACCASGEKAACSADKAATCSEAKKTN